MQHRMKTHPLHEAQMERLLCTAQTASLATVNSDGTPYVTPVHFLYRDGCAYVHGLPAGQKIENIKANPAVSLCVYEMEGLLLGPEERPCDTNTKYQSVILQGSASLLTDPEQKEIVLRGMIEKYTPHLSGRALPSNMVCGTAVIEIAVGQITGKYYA